MLGTPLPAIPTWCSISHPTAATRQSLGRLPYRAHLGPWHQSFFDCLSCINQTYVQLRAASGTAVPQPLTSKQSQHPYPGPHDSMLCSPPTHPYLIMHGGASGILRPVPYCALIGPWHHLPFSYPSCISLIPFVTPGLLAAGTRHAALQQTAGH
jgi:hypothetical protein